MPTTSDMICRWRGKIFPVKSIREISDLMGKCCRNCLPTSRNVSMRKYMCTCEGMHRLLTYDFVDNTLDLIGYWKWWWLPTKTRATPSAFSVANRQKNVANVPRRDRMNRTNWKKVKLLILVNMDHRRMYHSIRYFQASKKKNQKSCHSKKLKSALFARPIHPNTLVQNVAWRRVRSTAALFIRKTLTVMVCAIDFHLFHWKAILIKTSNQVCIGM